jgi:hypothetical protein
VSGDHLAEVGTVDSRPAYSLTIFIHDDDVKTYELRLTSDTTEIMSRVAAAVARGRHVHCYVFAGSREREERYLISKGYSRAAIEL